MNLESKPRMDPQRTEKSASSVRSFLRDCRAADRILPAALIIGTLIGSLYLLFISPPGAFPAPSIIKVKSGETLSQVAADFKAHHMVRSARILETFVRMLGGNRQVKEGSYFFSGGQNSFSIAMRLIGGDFELNPARVVVGEGADVRDIVRLLDAKLAPFDTEGFLALALVREGYLYPDTYFFYPGDDPDIVEAAMEHNFAGQTAVLAPAIKAFKKTEIEVVIMASLLEHEAATKQDRRIIAGILWKRIAIGMPLQVDSAFGYVLDKPLTKLTPADLKIDSPYNTYTNKGLPPTPIGNPSAAAIEAAVTPVKTNYLYYLSDAHGRMHYAATYAQHLANVTKYLR